MTTVLQGTSLVAQPFQDLSVSGIWDVVKEGMGSSLSTFLHVAPFVHLLFPRYSPFLWLGSSRECDKAMLWDLRQSNPEECRKWEHVQTRMGQIAVQFAIERPISLFIAEGPPSKLAEAMSGIPKISSPVVVINKKVLELSAEELDFVLASQLSHVGDLDSLSSVAMIFGSIAINYFALSYFAVMAPLYSFFIGLGFFALSIKLFSLFSISLVKKADLSAVRMLGSSAGAIRVFERMRMDRMEERLKSAAARFFMDERGELKLDLLSPSLQDRRASVLHPI